MFAAIFISRLPFISSGPGVDPDAWRIINAATHLHMTGEYRASRLPGYPVPEIVMSVISTFDFRILNSVTALMSAIGAVFFALSVRNLSMRWWWTAGVALSFVPVVYINSTNTMDYMWAASFTMVSLYFVTRGHPVIAGIFLGLGVGCRITTGAMLLPLSILLMDRLEKEYLLTSLRKVYVFCVVTIIVSGLVYVPVIFEYGIDVFTFFEHGYPDLSAVVLRATEGVWGRLGIIAIAIAGISIFGKITCSKTTLSYWGEQRIVLASVTCILLYSIAYLMLPHESGYLIPIVPFVVLLVCKTLPKRVYIVFCILLVAAPFVSFGKTGLYAGPILENQIRRDKSYAYGKKLAWEIDRLSEPSVVVVGYYLPMIKFIRTQDILRNKKSQKEVNTKHKVVYLLTKEEIVKYIERGKKILFVKGIDRYERRIYGIELRKYGGKEMVINFQY